ncbi:MAG TPA: FecR family protein, partial [Planctomycetota bacterium]|nr:FecR family protein [Planctomycetota bacterium]
PPAPPSPPAPERREEAAPEPPPRTPAPPPPPPAPGPTQPARAFLAVARLEGTVEIGDGKSWKKAPALPEWDLGVSLRAGERPARIVLAGGAALTLRSRARIRAAGASPPELFLDEGEVFCDVPPAPGRRFALRTRDALVRVTGTQFAVKEGDVTEVLVAAGEVVVSNDRGEARVAAGMGLAVRRSAAPGKPRAVDVDRALAWKMLARPPETVRLRFSFEDGRRPAPFDGGRVVPGPPRGLNRFCLEGTPGLHFDLRRADAGTAARPGLRVRFRYFAEKGGAIWVQLFNARAGDNFRYDVPHVAAGAWEAVEAPLEEFYRLADRSSALLAGDPLTWFNIAVSGEGRFYFDDVEIVEVQ